MPTDAKSEQDHQNRQTRDQRFTGSPEHFGKNDIVQIKWRIEQGIPGFLHMHAGKRRIQGLESGGHHDGHADSAAGEELDVGHTINRLQQATQPIAKGHQRDEWLGDIPDDAGKRELAPHKKIALPDGDKAQTEFRYLVVHGCHGRCLSRACRGQLI